MTNNPFDSPERRPSVSWKGKPVGTTITGTVVEEPKLVQSRDFETGEPATWPDGNPKMSVVVGLSINGEEFSLWAPKPSAMFHAIAAALKAAGEPMTEGGRLTVTFSGEKADPNRPRLNPQKLFVVKYEPPKPGDPFNGDDQPPF